MNTITPRGLILVIATREDASYLRLILFQFRAQVIGLL